MKTTGSILLAIVAMTLLPLGSAETETDARLACKAVPQRQPELRERPAIPEARLEHEARAIEGDLQDLRAYCESQARLGYP